MTKINLVIASILKPIDDPRMYEKIGITLSDSQKYSVHIVGHVSISPPINTHINFYSPFNFSRNSKRRISAPLKFYKILLKLKPKVVIVETPELLIVTVIYKILFGCRIYYDVLENYYYNILYLSKYSMFLKIFLGTCTRAVELITSPFIEKFILAEKCYIKELPFVKKKFAVLENKLSPIYHNLGKTKKRSFYHLLYTGTIAESFGIFEAIEVASKLNALDYRFHLTIIGYCADQNELVKIKNYILKLPFIHLIGGDYLVPHQQIMKMINTADIGLITYQANKAFNSKMPTKLYEYMYDRLPMIIPQNSLWVEFCRPYCSALVVNYAHIDVFRLICDLNSVSFYDKVEGSLYNNLLWERFILLGIIY